jgi:hypothetical protein
LNQDAATGCVIRLSAKKNRPKVCADLRAVSLLPLRPATPLVGSVAYFPERYGDELIPLALSILQKRPTPPAVFIEHQLITPANVGLFYPARTN